jgi:thiol:disulfide interchange protein
MKLIRSLFLLLFILGCPLVAEEDLGAKVMVELVSRDTSLQINGHQWVGLYFRMQDGWHIYADHPEQQPMIPKVTWELPDGAEVGTIQWPPAETFDGAGIESYGYKEAVLLPIPLKLYDELGETDTVTLVAKVSWIACKELCVPMDETLTLTLPLSRTAPQGAPQWAALFDEQVGGTEVAEAELGGLGWILVFAALGGLILNLMPCVLPVISLKVMSFFTMGGRSRAHSFLHGTVFTLGVLVSFWVLAGLLLALQSWGTAVGWGFQLQDPRFVGMLAVVFLMLGLSMLGVFEFGLLVASSAGQAQSKGQGLGGAFWSGVLATAVATPCTGPFLGPVLGYAITVPALEGILIFSAILVGYNEIFL